MPLATQIEHEIAGILEAMGLTSQPMIYPLLLGPPSVLSLIIFRLAKALQVNISHSQVLQQLCQVRGRISLFTKVIDFENQLPQRVIVWGQSMSPSSDLLAAFCTLHDI